MAKFWYEHLKRTTTAQSGSPSSSRSSKSKSKSPPSQSAQFSQTNLNNNNSQDQSALPPSSASRRNKEKAWFDTIKPSNQKSYSSNQTIPESINYTPNKTNSALNFLRRRDTKSQAILKDNNDNNQIPHHQSKQTISSSTSTSKPTHTTTTPRGAHNLDDQSSRLENSLKSSIGLQPPSAHPSPSLRASSKLKSSTSSPGINPDGQKQNYHQIFNTQLIGPASNNNDYSSSISNSLSISTGPSLQPSTASTSSSASVLTSSNSQSTYQILHNQQYYSPKLNSSPSNQQPMSYGNISGGGSSQEVELITQSLAVRLEELATANKDGLLDDEEYRTLRQGLFDQMASNEKDDQLQHQKNYHHRIQNLNLDDQDSAPDLESEQNLSPPPQQHQGSSRFLSKKAASSIGDRTAHSLRLKSSRSIRSTSSFLHALLRRQSKSIITKSDCESDSPRLSNVGSDRLLESESLSPNRDNSIFSYETRPGGGKDGSIISRSRSQINGQHNNNNNSQSGNSSNNSNRSQGINRPTRSRSHLQLQSTPVRVIMNKKNAKFTETKSDPQVRKRPSKNGASGNSHLGSQQKVVGISSSSNASTPTGPNARQQQQSSNEMRREISELEYECSRLVKTFEQMERDTIAKYRAAPRSGMTRTKLEEIDDLIQQNKIPNSSNSPALKNNNNNHVGNNQNNEFNRNDGERSRMMNNEDERGTEEVEDGRPISFLAPLRTARSLTIRMKNRVPNNHTGSNSPRLNHQTQSSSATFLRESQANYQPSSSSRKSFEVGSFKGSFGGREAGEERKEVLMKNLRRKGGSGTNTGGADQRRMNQGQNEYNENISNNSESKNLNEEIEGGGGRGEDEMAMKTKMVLGIDPECEVKLGDELEVIRLKKEAVKAKYFDRIEYLNAKLKGAMIREKERI